MRGQRHAPAVNYHRERPGAHCTGDWVGPRPGLDGRKISPPPGFDPRTVQPVVSRYTDWATRPTALQRVPGVKRPGLDVDHTYPTSAGVRNQKTCASTPPYAFMTCTKASLLFCVFLTYTIVPDMRQSGTNSWHQSFLIRQSYRCILLCCAISYGYVDISPSKTKRRLLSMILRRIIPLKTKCKLFYLNIRCSALCIMMCLNTDNNESSILLIAFQILLLKQLMTE